MRRPLTVHRALRGDVWPAVVLGAIGQIEVWWPSVGDPGSLTGPRWALSLTWATAAACVGFRRRAPFAALSVALVVSLLHASVVGAPEGLGGFLPLVVLFYSVASHERTALALAGLAIAVASAFAQAYLDPLNDGDRRNLVAGLGFSAVIVVAWAVGAAVRRRRVAAAVAVAQAAEEESRRQSIARAAADAERRRIARELHDVVSHSLGIIAIQAQAADELLDDDPAGARRALDAVIRTARDGLTEMRGMLLALRTLDDEADPDGRAALAALAEDVTRAGLPVALTIDDDLEIPRPLAAELRRIVQESLTNALRHAGASSVSVRIAGRDPVVVSIEDDGDGPPDGWRPGHGLTGIRERVADLGGALDVGARPAGGFRVHVSIPLEARP